ncbi:MAG: class I adenylate-forming enzyme family protein, partial [Pseudomonadota bacterium]
MSIIKWSRSFFSKKAEATQLEGLLVPQLLEAHLKENSESAALNIDGECKLSFNEWDQKSLDIANGIIKAGGTPGRRIALMYDGMDWINYAIAYMAVLRTGGVAIHLNAHLPEAEVQMRLEECSANWVIHSEHLPPVKNVRNFTTHSLSKGNYSPIKLTISADHLAEIRYTSGTTGRAKAYFLPHSNLTFGRTLENMHELSTSAGMLVPMTLGTSTSATILTVALTSPVSMIICSPIDIERMGELIESKKIDSLMLTPHIADEILSTRLNERYDFSSIKLFASASSPLKASTVINLQRIAPQAKVQIACAQSEASPALITGFFNPQRPHVVGIPSPITELKIMGKDKREKDVNELGEIWLRSPAPKRLFLNHPEINARILADGWYRTGDLGRVNAHGELEFFDREIDVLWRNDQPISSVILEGEILFHPKVKEVAVVGSPQGKHQTIIAFVILSDPGALQEVEKYCLNKLSESQCPDSLKLVTTLPKTQN